MKEEVGGEEGFSGLFDVVSTAFRCSIWVCMGMCT